MDGDAMEANLLSSPRIRLFVGIVVEAIRRGDHDPVFAAYFWGMPAVALAPAGSGRQRLRAAVVALAVALTGLVQLLVYVAAEPCSMALATWAVSAVFLVSSTRP